LKKLIIAGTGIKFLSHLSYEVQAAVKHSDCVLYLVNEPAIKNWIATNSKKSLSLDDAYFSCQRRSNSYSMIEKKVAEQLESYSKVCLLVYGNPVFFSTAAVKISLDLSKKGISVDVMPAISALDCLFTDLRVDPANDGFQSYEATSFVVYDHDFITNSSLILWQIGVIGIVDTITEKKTCDPNNRVFMGFLVEKLLSKYPPYHLCYIYVAAQYPGSSPQISECQISQLSDIDIDRLATLYIPPSSNKIAKKDLINLLY